MISTDKSCLCTSEFVVSYTLYDRVELGWGTWVHKHGLMAGRLDGCMSEVRKTWGVEWTGATRRCSCMWRWFCDQSERPVRLNEYYSVAAGMCLTRYQQQVRVSAPATCSSVRTKQSGGSRSNGKQRMTACDKNGSQDGEYCRADKARRKQKRKRGMAAPSSLCP